MNYYKNKTIVICGASTGIGKALSLEILKYNPKVIILADIKYKEIEIFSNIHNQNEIIIEAYSVDVSKKIENEKFFNEIIKKYKKIDIVFNNVGISLFGEFHKFSFEDWEKYINTNLWSSIYGTKLSYDQMVKQKSGGHIINTASLGGIIPQPMSSLYSATKHAVVGLSTSLANEGRIHDINISVVCPGFINTPIHNNLFIENSFDKEKVGALIKKQKGISAEICAKRILKKVSRKKVIITTDFTGYIFWKLYRMLPSLLTNTPKNIFSKYINSLKK